MPSYNERLTANNQKIDDITTLANELPDADEINEKIDEQDIIIENLKTALNDKAGKGDSTPNIFLQDEEPIKKQGIWLKTTGKEYEKVVAEDSVVEEPTWLPDGTAANIPYSFNEGSAVRVGSNIYLFGSNTNKTTAYKYNTLTNTYTQLINIPYDFYQGSAVVIGTDIYLLGSGNDSYAQYNYKYDTLTDTYTQLTDIPYKFCYGSAVAIGTDIYLLGSAYVYNNNYKYDTLMDTYTKMTDIPISYYQGSAVAIGTNIYILGGSNTSLFNYKYDVLTNTYTKMTNIPYDFYQGSAVAISTDIYLLGTRKAYAYKNNYKYDTLTDTYTQLTDIPYNFYTGSSVNVTNNIYLFGGQYYPQKVQVLEFPSNDFEDNSIVLLNGSTYKTQLFAGELVDSSVKYPFADAWYYTEQGGLETDIPTYYGDGTQWINIKNPIVEEVEE